MRKKVGKFVSIFLLCVVNFVYGSESAIILRMQDMNHEPITQAMMQAPFILQVELKNLEGYTDVHLMQYISGIENFKSSRSMTSHNVSVDNGKRTVKTFYNFVLRADKKGTFTIGPVQLKDKSGQAIRSNRLIVYVGDELLSAEKKQKEKYFISLEVDKKQAYVGEKVQLTIKFYDRLFVDDLHLQFPEFKNLHIVKNYDSLTKSMIELDGEEYSVTEWNFDVYPIESGNVILQDIKAAFFAPELESKFKLGGAFDFFRSLHKSEQYVVAKPMKIEVLPLPQHQKFTDIHAVGQFSKYSIKINQDKVPAGQGVVLTIELHGDGNFGMIPSPQLVLPDGFKYYDSNMVAFDSTRKSKKSEFIVQADQPGKYHIKPQSLSYFDPVDKKYKILESNGLEIIVTEPLHTLPSSQKTDVDVENITEEQDLSEKTLHDFKIIESGTIHAQALLVIPDLLFQRILWFLYCIWLSLFFYFYGIKKYLVNYPSWKKFIIFLRIKKSCKIAQQQNNQALLYHNFMELFAQLLDVPEGQLQNFMIIDYLKSRGFSDEQIDAWKIFNEKILQQSFFSHAKLDDQNLYEQALQWILQLKEKA